ncbi:uncharacterized protein GJ701_006883 [Geothlypis trichas]
MSIDAGLYCYSSTKCFSHEPIEEDSCSEDNFNPWQQRFTMARQIMNCQQVVAILKGKIHKDTITSNVEAEVVAILKGKIHKDTITSNVETDIEEVNLCFWSTLALFGKANCKAERFDISKQIRCVIHLCCLKIRCYSCLVSVLGQPSQGIGATAFSGQVSLQWAQKASSPFLSLISGVNEKISAMPCKTKKSSAEVHEVNVLHKRTGNVTDLHSNAEDFSSEHIRIM